MFLEIHTVIIDDSKRYLNLTDLTYTFPGWKSFGEWVDKGDYIECNAGWMACFSGYYNNKFSGYNLKFCNSDKIIKKFKPSQNNITDQTSAFMYALLTASKNNGTNILNPKEN